MMAIMILLFWIAYVLTVAEFIASPVNTLRGSEMHLQRLKEVHFPLSFARFLSWVELVAVIGVLIGLWISDARLIGGVVLALCFVPIIIWGIRAKRSMSDIFALLFFVACALVTAFYK